jgi:hypothetical protein
MSHSYHDVPRESTCDFHAIFCPFVQAIHFPVMSTYSRQGIGFWILDSRFIHYFIVIVLDLDSPPQQSSTRVFHTHEPGLKFVITHNLKLPIMQTWPEILNSPDDCCQFLLYRSAVLGFIGATTCISKLPSFDASVVKINSLEKSGCCRIGCDIRFCSMVWNAFSCSSHLYLKSFFRSLCSGAAILLNWGTNLLQ